MSANADIPVGRNIHARRLELGMSQRELAAAAGYSSRSAIAKLEAGAAEPPLSRLLPLARALDTSIEELLVGSGHIVAGEALPEEVAWPRDDKEACVALVLAAGKSGRNGLSVPTQFAGVVGKPVVSYVLESYEHQEEVQRVYAVCLAGWEDVLAQAAERAGASKLTAVVTGGESGLESVRAGVRRIAADGWPLSSVVVVQETARPLVDAGSVSRLIASCKARGSSVVCEPLIDHLAFERGDDGSMAYVNRDRLFSMQSPDAHRLSVLLDMFAEAETRGIPLEENCCGMLLHRLGWPLAFVEGARGNVKVVRREDLAVFASLVGRG